MKVSVIVPLYNKEKSVLRAINSVLCQTEQDFELIIVNDGSTDGSASLAADLCDDKKVRLFTQKNAGVSAARNRGVAEARTDLIAFLDADDEWLPEFLMTILELRSQFPLASVFGTLYSFRDQAGQLSLPKTANLFEAGYRGIVDNFLEIIRIGLPFNSSTFAVTKKAFEEISGFPVGIKYGEDVDTWIRLSLKYKICYANTSLAIYHHDAENRACNLYASAVDEYYPVKNLVQRIKNQEVPIHLKQAAIEYIAKSQVGLAKIYLYCGNVTPARHILRTCSGTKVYFREWFFLYLCSLFPPLVLRFLIRVKNVI